MGYCVAIMDMATRKDIFREKLEEYLQANKERKSEILDAVVEVVGGHRKAAIRKFRVLQTKDSRLPEMRGRPVYYTPDVTAVLKELWDIAGEPCGENFHAVIPEYVTALTRDKQWKHSDDVTGKLLAMSVGTVKNRVGNFTRTRISFGGKSTTHSTVMTQIPIRMDEWGKVPTGTCQIDTVAHCGDSVAGSYVFTVNGVDVHTLWGVRRAQWNKGMSATVTNMEAMEADLPFPLLEWHPDSGSEFMNQTCWERYGGKLTRSRPYKKNDNCFVEERNGHTVRTWIGYQRLDVPEVVKVLNELYDVLTPFLNHFVASRRLLSKERIGARWKEVREKKALTPYQRVLLRDDVSHEDKERLQAEHEKLNPLMLKQKIDRRRKKVLNMLKRHKKLDVFG